MITVLINWNELLDVQHFSSRQGMLFAELPAQLLLCYLQVNTLTFNVQKKKNSNGCYKHFVVAKSDTVWSNHIQKVLSCFFLLCFYIHLWSDVVTWTKWSHLTRRMVHTMLNLSLCLSKISCACKAERV